MRKRSKPLDGEVAEASNPAASLTRGLEILRAFTADDPTLGNQDLIERTGLPKATISRLTATLVSLGYLHYDQMLGRYSIGPATVSLGYSALSSNPVIHMARPLMQQLADKTGAAVALGTRDGLEMVYLANCRSMSPVTLRLNIGSRVPICRTAMGLAYLAEMKPQIRESVVEELLRPEKDKAALSALIEKSIADYRRQGFVSVYGTWHSYINAVGVAFRPTDGSPLVALTCGGIVDVMPEALCQETVGPDLVELARRLRANLAGEGEPAPPLPYSPSWNTSAE
ncbi:IclR family transcriptional regulator [Rhizobium sp. SSA_523]|uniref:IclR family transcriptional regulator n=1 Tax=Rhizobium sp. SSA_523 TaxID=2952477 RepID=UPI002090D151|nr:IclR family transcriptional regulator [Rhizobium sp. SSA_523]MCO5731502.1 IclR family transcriptional regulator [Rhizobium sp. SSA_523]WKC21980.1 IclR family transcriptional regulator [Rhizobium sp. SSA_523]